jgi:hypothetical protein
VPHGVEPSWPPDSEVPEYMPNSVLEVRLSIDLVFCGDRSGRLLSLSSSGLCSSAGVGGYDESGEAGVSSNVRLSKGRRGIGISIL